MLKELVVLVPKVVASSNLGLQLANAFGVLSAVKHPPRVATLMALANSSPGLKQPWDRSARPFLNAEGVG